MWASPYAVTRFGCGEIDRSGSSSNASSPSRSLTKALLMVVPIVACTGAVVAAHLRDGTTTPDYMGIAPAERDCVLAARISAGTIPRGKSSFTFGTGPGSFL